MAYYENEQKGLGQRYHAEFKAALALAREMPLRPRIVQPPDFREINFKVFHFSVIYRALAGEVQVLAIAPHRRKPGYWLDRA